MKHEIYFKKSIKNHNIQEPYHRDFNIDFCILFCVMNDGCLSHCAIWFFLTRLSWMQWKFHFVFISFFLPLHSRRTPLFAHKSGKREWNDLRSERDRPFKNRDSSAWRVEIRVVSASWSSFFVRRLLRVFISHHHHHHHPKDSKKLQNIQNISPIQLTNKSF